MIRQRPTVPTYDVTSLRGAAIPPEGALSVPVSRSAERGSARFTAVQCSANWTVVGCTTLGDTASPAMVSCCP